jgi:hypothetical protein
VCGEFLLQIRWKINCAENSPGVAHQEID